MWAKTTKTAKILCLYDIVAVYQIWARLEWLSCFRCYLSLLFFPFYFSLVTFFAAYFSWTTFFLILSGGEPPVLVVLVVNLLYIVGGPSLSPLP